MLAGSLPGALLLKHVDARAIKLVFGVVVIGLGTAMLLPFAALGLFAGMKCSRVLDEKWVRRLTSVLLVLSGVSLIAVNL